ncbi:MAG: hypothetical protein WEF50_18310 [Myxococcota bacterium]
MTPVGVSMRQSCAAIRAGISRFGEHAYYWSLPDDPDWGEEEPLISASALGIDPFVDAPERHLALASGALVDLVAEAGLSRADLHGVTLLASLPVVDAATAGLELDERFVAALLERTGLPRPGRVEVCRRGHTGVFELVARATEAIGQAKLDAALILGVDSYLFEKRLELWDRDWRLRSQRNVDGFVPGEAGTALLLESDVRVQARGATGLCRVSAFGFGQEPNTPATRKASLGEGIVQAFDGALGAGARPAPWVICDLNGESYRAFEWGLAQARQSERFGETRSLLHPAECVGDVGAATGGVLLACAAAAFERGWAIADEALLWTASDDGLRAALRVSRTD